VHPVALHGAETWSYREGAEADVLRKWQMKHARQICDITPTEQWVGRIRNETILNDNKQIPLDIRAKAKRHRFIGHVYRREEVRWNKFALTARLACSQNVGRRVTWQKQVRESGEKMLEKFPADHEKPFRWSKAKARDRSEWMDYFWDFHEIRDELRPGWKVKQNQAKKLARLNRIHQQGNGN
jgi:hypothetical protein